MGHGRQRLVSFGSQGLLAFALLHCAGGEELDFDSLRESGAHKGGSKGGSSGLAAGGAAGDLASGGESGSGGLTMDDASSSGGQGGSTGSTGGAAGIPVDSGAAGGAMVDVVTFDVAPCPTCSLSVQYSLQKTAEPTQEIGFNLMIKNTGNKAVAYNQIALRYWYTINGESAQEAVVDYSMPGGAAMQFVKVMPARTNADYYAEMKYAATGDLATGQIALLNGRFHKAGYQGTYTQSDDYSYGAGHTASGDWPKITAYVGGDATPVWGTEP